MTAFDAWADVHEVAFILAVVGIAGFLVLVDVVLNEERRRR